MLDIFPQSLGQSREHMILHKKGNSDRPDWSKLGGHHLYLCDGGVCPTKWTHVWTKQLYYQVVTKFILTHLQFRARRTHIHSNFPLSDLLFLVVGSSIVLFLLLHDSFLSYIVLLMLSLQIPLPQEQLQLRP